MSTFLVGASVVEGWFAERNDKKYGTRKAVHAHWVPNGFCIGSPMAPPIGAPMVPTSGIVLRC